MQQSNKIANLCLHTDRDEGLNAKKEDIQKLSKKRLNFRFPFRQVSDAEGEI
jgi:hypothetical protein